VADFVYNLAKKQLLDGSLDLDTDDIRVMLVDSGYTANKDHDYVDGGGADDPVDHELSGTGYTGGYGGSGRKALASRAVTEDDTNDAGKFDAADVTWSAINAGTAACAIVIKKGTADDTTAVLIAHYDTGFPVVTNGGDVTLQWNANGILALT